MYNSKSAAAEAASSDADRKHAMKVLRELLARPDMAEPMIAEYMKEFSSMRPSLEPPVT